jgi:hypothetical protein
MASNPLSQEVRKRSGGFFPRKGSAPNGLGKAYTLWSGSFAVGPGDFLDGHHPAPAAIDATHGRGLMAARTDRGGPLARPHEHLDALMVGTEANPMIDKPPEAVAAV